MIGKAMNHLLRPQTVLFISVVVISSISIRAAARETSQEAIRRLAFIAGANDGGPSRVPLRYAHTDAKTMARVLRQLGGVSRRDSVVLLEPDRFDFEAGLARIRNRLDNVRQPGVRLELVIYYSGHSDEQGLMLGDDLMTYRELREAIGSLPADVRVAILDSCSSGALTRGKGGTRRAPFLMDTSVDVKGYAYLTSSSADETAQESDRVGGSFFTHYLVSGLRGAADTNQDSKVTLNEAYQYAFDETLARTESTQGGPQHPNYDFQLKGSGDLVLTDLRGTSAILVLDSVLDGRIFVRNRKGQLVAEINKPAGHPVTMGLEPGKYEVTLESNKELKRGTIALQQGRETRLTRDELKSLDRDETVLRGSKPDETPLEDDQEEDEIIHRPFSIGFVPGLATGDSATGKVRNNFAVNFIGMGEYLAGFEGGMIGNIRTDNVRGFQGAGIFNLTMGDVRGGQAAGIFNLSGSSMYGYQAAGIINVVKGPCKGFQGAGIANVNASSSIGFQGAGIFNLSRGKSAGFQGAGIVNVNREFSKGFQAAAIANINVAGYTKGFQGAAIANATGSIKGAQLSAIVNVARDSLHGFQSGLVNYAGDVEGVQLGLINISKKNRGVPIGLINIAGDGVLAPAVWASDTSLVNVGLKVGSRHVYSILGYGIHPIGDEKRDALIVGLGGHIEFKVPVWLELDLTSNWLHADYDWGMDDNNIDALFKFRPTIGWRVADQLSIFAGPTLNLLVSDIRKDVGLIPSLTSTTYNSETNVELSVGFLAGLQWEPKWGNLNTQGKSK